MNRHIALVCVVVVLAVALCALPASAKKTSDSYKKGAILLGGGLDFSLFSGSTTIKPEGGEDANSDQFEMGMETLAGYFLISKLEVGGLLSVDYSSNKDDAGKTTDTTWAIAPQVGYFYPVAKKISVFGMLPIGYMKNSTETDPDQANAKNTGSDNSGFFFEPRGGVVYHLNSRIGLFGSLFFRYYSGSGSADSGAQNIDFDVKNSQYGLKVGLFGFL